MDDLVRRHRWWMMRVAVLPLHVLVFAVAIFFLVRAVPGDPVVTMTGGQITPEQLAAARASLGLDGSIVSQLGHFLSNLVHLDLGESIVSGRSVWEEVATRLPATLELVVLGLLASALFTLGGAYLVVMRPRNPVSRVLSWYARVAGAIPEFTIGIAFIFVFYATLRWAPAPIGRFGIAYSAPEPITGFPLLDAVLQGDWAIAGSMVQHLVLPIMVMTLGHSGTLLKLLISALDEAIDAPATLFRIASGAPRWLVILSVYRRALPATATMFGLMFGSLIGGAVVLEQLFGLGGMGQFAVDAVNTSDITAIQGFLVVMVAISLVVFMLMDVITMSLDPRRRSGARLADAA
ncbi:ABC transporter permease [Mycolicibacterium palauense]|uniref:ABC transporter permease n=1 Tax=Mycolicibacterium palauense TaxID=2034511 RepID=UPI001FEC0F90|nr:ABC transporter permease [Mycolicibacterium palauense]